MAMMKLAFFGVDLKLDAYEAQRVQLTYALIGDLAAQRTAWSTLLLGTLTQEELMGILFVGGMFDGPTAGGASGSAVEYDGDADTLLPKPSALAHL